MGLQGQLNDVSSDSIPLMLLALVAGCVNHLCSFMFGLLHFLGLHGSTDLDDGAFTSSVGSGLAGLIVLAEQLNLNRLFSYSYRCRSGETSDCVVCLCRFKDGDQVRKLDCLHVFHKECFDGWLDHLNFNCPLCRSPLVAEEGERRRVGRQLMSWFPMQ